MMEARTRTVDLGPGRPVPLTVTEDGAGGTALLRHGRGGPGSVQGIGVRLSGTTRVPPPSSRLERRPAVDRQGLRKSGRSRLVLSPPASPRLRSPEMRLTPQWGTE
jgi:hypothetical protein